MASARVALATLLDSLEMEQGFCTAQGEAIKNQGGLCLLGDLTVRNPSRAWLVSQI